MAVEDQLATYRRARHTADAARSVWDAYLLPGPDTDEVSPDALATAYEALYEAQTAELAAAADLLAVTLERAHDGPAGG